MNAISRPALWLLLVFFVGSAANAQVSVRINFRYEVTEDGQIDIADSAYRVEMKAPAGWFAYYTLDGTEPTVNSTPVTGPLGFWPIGQYDLRVVGFSSDLSESDRLRVLINVVPSVTLSVEGWGFFTLVSDPPAQEGLYLTNSIITLTGLSKDGWTFKEWRGTYNTNAPTIQFTLDSSTFLTPVHTTEFSVASNGPGTVRVEPQKDVYERGELVVLHAEPSEGAFLSSWSVPGIQDPFFHLVTEPNRAVTGNFQHANEGQVTLDAEVLGRGGYLLPNPARWVFFPGEKVTVTGVPVEGAFKGWLGDTGAITNKKTFTITQNSTVTGVTERLLKWSTLAGSAMSPPSIGKDGRVYTTSHSHLFAWAPDGSLSWSAAVQDLRSTSIGPSGVIYTKSTRDLRAYTPGGEFLWSIPFGADNGLAISSDETLYITDIGNLYSFDANGEKNWEIPVSRFVRGSNPIISKNGIILLERNSIGDVRSTSHAYDSSGTFLWTGPELHPIRAADPFGNLIAIRDGSVMSLKDQDGSTNWVVGLPYDEGYHPIIGEDGSVYAMGNRFNLTLYKISPAGEVLWSKDSGGTPTVDAGNLLYHFGRPPQNPWEPPPVQNYVDLRVLQPDASLVFLASFSGNAQWATLGADNTLYWVSGTSELKAVRVPNGPALNAWSTYLGNPQRTSSILSDQGNQPPLLPIINSQVHSGGEWTEFEIIVSDDASSGEAITITTASDNDALVSEENINVSGSGEARVVRITPTPGVYGFARITITATDEDGLSSTRDFLFTVEDRPVEPELIIDLVPAITLRGEVGQSYRVESRPKVESGAWALLTTVTLTNELQHVYVDLETAGQDRFYRAVLTE